MSFAVPIIYNLTVSRSDVHVATNLLVSTNLLQYVNQCIINFVPKLHWSKLVLNYYFYLIWTLKIRLWSNSIQRKLMCGNFLISQPLTFIVSIPNLLRYFSFSAANFSFSPHSLMLWIVALQFSFIRNRTLATITSAMSSAYPIIKIPYSVISVLNRTWHFTEDVPKPNLEELFLSFCTFLKPVSTS